MALAPGPFLQLGGDAVSIDPGVYDFTDDAQNLSSSLNVMYDSLTPFVADLLPLAEDPLDDLTGPALDSVALSIAIADTLAAVPSIDDALTSFETGDVLLTQAISFAPPQAFIDPPQPFLPPPDTPSVPTPTVPLGAFAPGSYVASAPLPNPTGPYVQLLNITRVGQTNFVVGDQFKVIGLGTAGQRVTVSATFQGQELGTSDYGTLGSDGTFSLTGTMSPENVGAWFETWYFDDQPIASFNFLVAAGNIPL